MDDLSRWAAFSHRWFLCLQIISGNFKLILGLQTYGLWYGPRYPNATTNHSTDGEFDCGSGCLFDIVSS